MAGLVTSNAKEIADKMIGLSKTTPIASEKSVRKGAQIVKNDTIASAAAVTGGSLRLRGVKGKRGGRGARLGVTYKVEGSGSTTTAIVKAVGPWALIERDVKAHDVGVRGQVLILPDGGFATGPFIAGGSRGKHPWKKGTAVAQPKVARLYDREVKAHIRKNF